MGGRWSVCMFSCFSIPVGTDVSPPLTARLVTKGRRVGGKKYMLHRDARRLTKKGGRSSFYSPASSCKMIRVVQ